LYSLQLQAIVDHRICFLDVGDARVFEWCQGLAIVFNLF
jgi:hypothetical protein